LFFILLIIISPLRNPFKNNAVCVFVKDPEEVSRDALAKISEIKEVRNK
jgi:hypothetical protein